MRTLFAMALLLGVCAACSKQPAATAAPPPATDSKPAASVTGNPPAATVTTDNVAPSPDKTPVWSPTTNPGYAAFNQYDPSMRVPMSR